MGDFTVGNAGGLEELSPWRRQWDELAAAHQLPMLRYQWVAAAERHLAEPGSGRSVHVMDQDQNLVAALPLQKTSDENGHTRYEMLGQRRLYEPTDMLYRDDSARSRLLSAAASLGDPIMLSRLWPSRSRADAAAAIPAGRVRVRCRAIELGKPSAPSQHVRLEGDYEAYSKTLPPRRRYDLRRAYRRAADIGHLSIDFATPGPEELHRGLDAAFEVEARSWKSARHTNVKANPDLRAFFYQTLSSYATTHDVLVGLLSIEGDLAAAQVCLRAHRRIWILKIGYDDAFRRMSPGLILMNELIHYGHDNGFLGIEFLGSAEGWLDAWRPEMRHYRLMALYPYTPRSLACLGGDIFALARCRTRPVNRV